MVAEPESLAPLEERLGVKFRQPALLRQALVHSSYTNEKRGAPVSDNERLEFLGDAVLSVLVAESLYIRFPHLSEGELTQLRSELVRQESLARLARSLDLGGFLLLSRGEELGGGRKRARVLAGALEAVIGAMYLDAGLNVCRDFVVRLMAGREMERAEEKLHEKDYKSALQETIQALGMAAPLYRTVEAAGPDHEKAFVVEALMEGEVLGHGTGRSKRQAEQEAAREALEKLEGKFQEYVRVVDDVL